MKCGRNKQPTRKSYKGDQIPNLSWKSLSNTPLPNCRHRRRWHHPRLPILRSSQSNDWLAYGKSPWSTSANGNKTGTSTRYMKHTTKNHRRGKANQCRPTTHNRCPRQQGKDMARIGPHAVPQIWKHLLWKRLRKISRNEKMGSRNRAKSRCPHVHRLSHLSSLAKRKGRTKRIPHQKSSTA